MCTLDWQTHGVDGVDELARLAELHETLPQVVEGPLHQNLLLLVVVQQVVPQRLLGEGFGVAHNDHTVPVGQECTASRVYPASRVYQERNTTATEERVLISPGKVSPGSGERHIETAGVVEEANALVLVGPHARQDNEVLLSALEGVHAGYFHLLYKDRETESSVEN